MRGPTVEDDYEGTRDLGKEQEKLTAHNKETQSNPILDDIDYFCNMGFDLYVQDKYDEAIKYFDKVLAIDPNYNLARAQRTKAINSNENLNNKKKDFWKR